ncbi:MAG: hypothetical protein ACYC2G_14785 [Gemmatimonadaceae bacterium]
MIRRLALGAVVASTILITLAYASAFLPAGAPPWATWAFVVGTAAMMTAMMMLGAARPGRPLGGLWLAFLFTFVVLVGGFGIAIVLPPPTATSPLWLGLPAGAAAVLYGVGLLPLAVLPLAYALTFDDRTLSEADLARLRAAAGVGGDGVGTGSGSGRGGGGVGAGWGGGGGVVGGPPPRRHDTSPLPRPSHPSTAPRTGATPRCTADLPPADGTSH